ncbi:hypothetical protein F53441_6195 [Fusarium austroafricanum]|uniref:Protein kinase domain-containing protein n=1 Tax=Fusarium austroafricanum TaxID=2364996 RepID=A0A8H4P7D7_9HYPO|nr:hypothetical protein F53441_6195 [Fusarium austroafricanum]
MKGEEIRINGVGLNFQEHQQQRGHCKIKKRNFLTIQSALIRGDTEVTLYNRDPLERIRWEDYKRAGNDINQVEALGFQVWKDRDKEIEPLSDTLEQDAQRYIQNRHWYGLRFKFVKVLARGGHGYVSLWDVIFDDNSVKRVVIKKGLSPAFRPIEESRFHLRYQRAEHTTQVINLNHEARVVHEKMRAGGLFYPSNITQGNLWDAARQKCVVFEYAPWGDMVDILTKVAMRKVHFPDQVLWGIWECFVLGLAAIAYQPELDEGSFEPQWEFAKATNQTDDFLDWVGKLKITHDVHLDLEVFNILAGQNDGSHPHQPVFKIHDLGAWSFKMSEAWPNMTEAGYWLMRGPVKLHGLTPEQITKDWDSLGVSEKDTIVKGNFAGDDLTKGNPVAGRYGIWTNTFLIARVMESTMTGIYSRFPLQCAPHYTEHGKSAAKTYGWMLQTPQYAHIDPELRDIVSRCLYERPQDRPSIIDLLRNIAARRVKGFPEAPEAVGEWWNKLLGPSEERPLPEPPRPNVGPAQQAMPDQLNPLLNPNEGSLQWNMAGAGTGRGQEMLQGINPQPKTVQKPIVKEMTLDASSDVSPLTLVAQEALLGMQEGEKHINAQTKITHGLLPQQTGQDTNPHPSATQNRIAKEMAPKVTSSLSSGTMMAQEMSVGVQASKENVIPQAGAQNPVAGLLDTQEMFQHNSEENSEEGIYDYGDENGPDRLLSIFERWRAQQAVPAESSSAPAFPEAVTGHDGEFQPETTPEVEPESNSPELPPPWVFDKSSKNTTRSQAVVQPPSEMDTRNDGTIAIQPANTGFQVQQPPSGTAPLQGMGWFQPRQSQQGHGQQSERPSVCSPLVLPTHGYRDPLNQDSPDTLASENGTLNRANAKAARNVRLVASPTSPKSVSSKSVKSSKVSKRAPKTKKARRIASPHSSNDITAYVQTWLPDMPVAIRNLVTRSKHLEAQLKGGNLPVYAYMD